MQIVSFQPFCHILLRRNESKPELMLNNELSNCSNAPVSLLPERTAYVMHYLAKRNEVRAEQTVEK